ncbi:MAG: hypothetical protein PWQ67_487 [Clostridia bacterium]|jgi:hypothetical protein|nr:hypothetical protein [Clostridia bacterium]MDN5322033.1 hypothetical protein [Clostridia bacterium]
MKKILTVLLMVLLLVTFVGSAFAQEGISGENEKLQKRQVKFAVLKEFTDEIHTINGLRMERNTLQNEVIQKHDAILDLYIVARESGDKEALTEAKKVREQIRDINGEIKGIREQIKEGRKVFREAVKNGNLEMAQEQVNSVINLMTMINEKVKVKINLLQDIIEILS